MNCRVCNSSKENTKGQWWNLNNYFGLSGRFCSNYYNKVSHNSYGQPNNPKDYTFVLLKLSGVKNA